MLDGGVHGVCIVHGTGIRIATAVATAFASYLPSRLQ